MTKPTVKTIKTLFAWSGDRCAFPKCSVPAVDANHSILLEICHIEADKPGGARFNAGQTPASRQSQGNLILLCGTHHKIVDDKPERYTVEILKDMKAANESRSRRSETPEDVLYAKMLLADLAHSQQNSIIGNAIINSPGAVQSNVIQISSRSEKVIIPPPPGTIGASQQQSRYISYLIEKYNKFAIENKSRNRNFSFGAISNNINSIFKNNWRLLSSERFQEVCEYLQTRIDKTIIAKNTKSRGYRSYKLYDEFNE